MIRMEKELMNKLESELFLLQELENVENSFEVFKANWLNERAIKREKARVAKEKGHPDWLHSTASEYSDDTQCLIDYHNQKLGIEPMSLMPEWLLRLKGIEQKDPFPMYPQFLQDLMKKEKNEVKTE
jgi:hypothetical protein